VNCKKVIKGGKPPMTAVSSRGDGRKYMQNQIDLYIISGFLGAGKTTFLKKMLTNLEGKKAGVLINEFGSLGIDGRLIEKAGIRLVEINNGSIFCSCLKGNFINALIEFSKIDIDILLIENSGMSDPSNIHQILEELADKVGRKYRYRGAVCIADSSSFLKHVKVLAPVQNQIASSNLILVNKIDLVNQQTLITIEDQIHQVNSSANIFRTMYSEIPLTVLDSNLADNGYIGATSNEPWNRPATYSLESERHFSKEDLVHFIQRIENYILRVKGFAQGDSGWWKVDAVGDFIEVTEYSLEKRDVIKRTNLVIIGRDTKNFKNVIVSAWEGLFHEIPEIYDDYDGCQLKLKNSGEKPKVTRKIIKHNAEL
jgi:G3E family GTPase